MSTDAKTIDVRARCRGVRPLEARLESWQRALLEDSDAVAELVESFGSPVNVIDPAPMGSNAAELQAAADRYGVDLGIFFARKANKALALVDEARRLGLGVDVASEAELRQVLERGVQPQDMILTAAVKPSALLQVCLEAGVTVSIDNEDELRLLVTLASQSTREALVAFRIAPDLGPERIQTRFGIGSGEVAEMADIVEGSGAIRIAGIHFHLDGYSQEDRVRAIDQCLDVVDVLALRGHRLEFLDIGGGIPMSYLESERQWRDFWIAHSERLFGPAPLTFDAHRLSSVYPYFQAPVRGEWLAAVLAAEVAPGTTVAAALRERGLQLRCEPGRSLLDGCGVTIARVEFRKRRQDGTWLIGLAMNRTQCRSTSDDFMVDPLLVRQGEDLGGEEIEGYLVGAYCIERELLTLRRLRFPAGVQVGDLIVFPNTGGYLMHILESASHQIPLAKNVVLAIDRTARVDDIDLSRSAAQEHV